MIAHEEGPGNLSVTLARPARHLSKGPRLADRFIEHSSLSVTDEDTDCQRGERQAMDTTDTIRRIEGELGMSQTYQVTTFEGVRDRPDGSLQEVSAEVFDAGEDAGARRYMVTLNIEGDFEDDEDEIIGNPAPTLDEALSDVSAQLG
jgi:hypothetical protein